MAKKNLNDLFTHFQSNTSSKKVLEGFIGFSLNVGARASVMFF